MAIGSDSKDWTWVLEQPRAECGFDPSQVEPRSVAAAVRASIPAWIAVLDRPGAHRRPDGSVFTVETLLLYFWHDVSHHLVDVEEVATSHR